MPPLPPVSERHSANKAAFLSRDLEAYMRPFAATLRYQQADGRIIDRETLRSQVAKQLKTVTLADWTFRVTDTTPTADGVIETGEQLGWIASTAFGILHRIWHLERRGKYTWHESLVGWQITKVEILEESVRGAGFQLGWRPRAPAPS